MEVVRRRPILLPLAVTAVMLVVWAGWVAVDGGSGGVDDEVSQVSPDDTSPGSSASTTTTEPPLPPFDGWVDPASSGRPWGDTVDGILTFRGNPTRSWYGTGPMPEAPQVLWTYPPDGGGMCGVSIDGSGAQTWCGTGWTGQPAVFERDGVTWVAFGAYDYGVHFVDGATGTDLLPMFETGDIIKGSVTVDPDGYPLLYTGSRDNQLRVLAFDGEAPRELYRLDADSVGPTLWNDDWDGSPLVIDDYLFEGGENSRFHILKLNRSTDATTGAVTVAPELVFHTEITDNQVSIENSVAISGDTVYFANSGGLVQGWDISGLVDGIAPARSFRFWTGDDTDASIVVDTDGMLYVASEFERGNARSTEVGQLMKLDPTRPDDPLVWSVKDQAPSKSGAWGTPAIWGDMIYADFNSGRVIGARRDTGEIVWEKDLGSQTWQSPVVVDDVLVLGDCEGVLHGYDVSDPDVDPPEIWSVQLDGCIESTPAVWNGVMYVGARGGSFYAIGDPK
jgi:hypothetical protein